MLLSAVFVFFPADNISKRFFQFRIFKGKTIVLQVLRLGALRGCHQLGTASKDYFQDPVRDHQNVYSVKHPGQSGGEFPVCARIW